MTKVNYEEVKKQLVQLTRDLILIPTTASRPAEIKRGLQLIRNHIEILDNVEIKFYEDKGVPSIVACPKGCEIPDILMCSHLDVIDYECPSIFKSEIRDNRIYGPGAGDMKGALAITLEIFKHFHMMKKNVSLGLCITSDEETGGESGVGFLFGKKDLKCGIAMVPDGGSLSKVTTHEKGILHLKLKCKGDASHAARPWMGDNAVLKLAKTIYQLNSIFDNMKEGEENWHPTISPTIFKTPNETINRLPSYAEGVFDIRFPYPHTSSEMLNTIKKTIGPDINLEVIIRAEPSDLNPDPLYYKVAEKIIGQKIDDIRDHGGSDARFIAERGISVIISRPIVGNLHSEEEWIDIDSMVSFYRIYQKFIETKLNLKTKK